MTLTFDDFEASLQDTYTHRPDSLTYAMLGLAGETGEVVEKYKKAMRVLVPGQIPDSDFALDIANELGDVLWYVARICQELEIPMRDVAQMNIAKLAARRAEAPQ